MSTKAKIQKVRAEVEAHEERGWLRGYEQGLAVREEEIKRLQKAMEGHNSRIRELSRQKNGPKTAREALALAWELAHPVNGGDAIPKDTTCLQNTGERIETKTLPTDWTPAFPKNIRTLEPLPDPEPDWLDAPAVLAESRECSNRSVWTPEAGTDRQTWESSCCNTSNAWNSLRDVTPLYPKEGQDSFHYDEPWGTRLGGESA